MSEDLIAIIGCCILGLMAHGARKHHWLEWVLRVTYGLFLFGEAVNLYTEQLVPTGEAGWTYGVMAGTAVLTTMLLFKQGRQILSLGFTLINQIAGGRVILAALGKLQIAVSVPIEKKPLVLGGENLRSLAPKFGSPIASAPPSGVTKPVVVDETNSSSALTASDATAESVSNPAQLDGNAAKESGESVQPGDAAFESADAAKSDGNTAFASGDSVSDYLHSGHDSASMEPLLSAGSEKSSASGVSADGIVEVANLESSTGTTSQTAAAHASSSRGPNPPLESMSSPSMGSASPLLVGSKAAANGATTFVMQKATVWQSFLAERVFVPESIPHMNGLWIYVTCLAFLLAHTEVAGFQMPSIMIPMPVTFDQLFSYNFLGLVFLAFCGCGILVTRKPLETLKRLGLVKPTLTQVLIGVAGIIVTFAYDWLWSYYTHSQEGLGYADKLSHYNEGTFTGGAAPGPAFAVASATGLCAGLGEEILIRGGLQPVFGLVPAAFMHGVLHGQFAHAPLLIMQVFGWSCLMGILRRYTNTTTTIITHVGFNFLSTFLIAFNP